MRRIERIYFLKNGLSLGGYHPIMVMWQLYLSTFIVKNDHLINIFIL